MSLHIVSNLLFYAHDLWIIFNNFFLSISHNLIPFYLFANNVDSLFDWLAVLFQKLQSMIDKLILSLLQACYVRLYMFMVKCCIIRAHYIYCKLKGSLQPDNNQPKVIQHIWVIFSQQCILYIFVITMKNRISNFEIQTKLGSGSYGVIYKALNKSTKQICVLKQISLGRLNEKAKKNAVNEATIMGKLIHPFIVRYKESFIEDNSLNIVMEYCDSGDLSNFLKMQNKRPLKQQKIWKIFLQICVGMQYIHKNRILHRDIKTLNIFMNKNQEIKIGDLGVAKMLTSNQFAQTMVGTPFYLSPELCQQKPYNQKSDIWALGCLLYELCTYRHPFQAQNQASLILKIIRGKYLPIPQFYSSELKVMIDLCLERDYKRRPTTSNILSRPKIIEYYKQFGIDKIVDDYMLGVQKGKQMVLPIAKPLDEPKGPSQKQKIKQNELQAKRQITKKQEVKRQQPKRQVPLPKQNPVQLGQRKLQNNISEKKINLQQQMPRRESKNQFISNLQKLIDESGKNQPKKVIKQGPKYTEIPVKANDIPKKQDRYNKIAAKIEQIKKDQKVADLKSPNSANIKKPVPSGYDSKPLIPIQAAPIISKKSDVIIEPKPSVVKPQSKPPMPPSSAQKPQLIKVKNDKPIQAKVFDSQKNMVKPQIAIKSAGFTTNIENSSEKVDKQKQPSQHSNSRQKIPRERNIFTAKRSSASGVIKQEKIQSQDVKQLFGIIPSPSIQQKSQKNFKPVAVPEQKILKKQEPVNVSRVRKGGQNSMARNAKLVSRYNQISKQERDQVMNLPTNLKKGSISSDSEDQSQSAQKNRDPKAKTNKKFMLKDIDNQLVLQKYQDLMKNSQENNKESYQNAEQVESETEQQTNKQFENEITNQIQQVKDRIIQNDQRIIQQPGCNRKASGASNDQIEQILQSEQQERQLQRQQDLEKQVDNQYYDQRQQWSFDEQPQLPLLQEKQSPYFEEDNPYLVEQQQQEEESIQKQINYLQLKLKQNIKRQDEINKLMQIKIQQCRRFIGSQKTFQEILDFFRKKLHSDDYVGQDQKQIDNFLIKKGLTDHRKFQNIYKIMHFEMELENTRTIIQRICKKMNELQPK